MRLQLLQKRQLSLETDCVEFSPLFGLQNTLAVGCYHLDTSSNERKGMITTFQIGPSSDPDLGLSKMECTGSVNLPGVLDMKWSSSSNSHLMCAAGSNGHVYLLKDAVDVQSECRFSNGLLLSIDWTLPERIVASSSLGEICISTPDESDLTEVLSWKAHDLEVWSVSSDKHRRFVVYSGADDSRLKVWDTRMAPDCVMEDGRSHKAGVCAIVPDPYREFRLVTGSYDETLRIFDTRHLASPVCALQMSLGGGVWRIKPHPSKSDIFAVACMYDGFKIVSAGSDLEITDSFKDAESLSYGIDWRCVDDSVQILAGCSFYDRSLYLWKCV